MINPQDKPFCSGVIVAKDRILTNAHCVEFEPTGKVRFLNKQEVEYKIVKKGVAFTNKDLALLEASTGDRPIAKWEKNPKVGDLVAVVSSPHGHGWTFSVGVISNLWQEAIDYATETNYGFYLQHTAAIARGSSGSGVFTLNGELIGINTLTSGTFSYAIPLSILAEFLTDALPNERKA